MLLHNHAPHSPLNMSRVHIACFLLSSCSDLPFACFDIYSMPKSNWLLGVNLQQNFPKVRPRRRGKGRTEKYTPTHHIVYNNVPHHFCTLKRVALGCFLVSSSTSKLPPSPANHFVMSTCIKHQLFKSGMTFLTDRGGHGFRIVGPKEAVDKIFWQIIPDSLHLGATMCLREFGGCE